MLLSFILFIRIHRCISLRTSRGCLPEHYVRPHRRDRVQIRITDGRAASLLLAPSAPALSSVPAHFHPHNTSHPSRGSLLRHQHALPVQQQRSLLCASYCDCNRIGGNNLSLFSPSSPISFSISFSSAFLIFGYLFFM